MIKMFFLWIGGILGVVVAYVALYGLIAATVATLVAVAFHGIAVALEVFITVAETFVLLSVVIGGP